MKINSVFRRVVLQKEKHTKRCNITRGQFAFGFNEHFRAVNLFFVCAPWTNISSLMGSFNLLPIDRCFFIYFCRLFACSECPWSTFVFFDCLLVLERRLSIFNQVRIFPSATYVFFHIEAQNICRAFKISLPSRTILSLHNLRLGIISLATAHYLYQHRMTSLRVTCSVFDLLFLGKLVWV